MPYEMPGWKDSVFYTAQWGWPLKVSTDERELILRLFDDLVGQSKRLTPANLETYAFQAVHVYFVRLVAMSTRLSCSYLEVVLSGKDVSHTCSRCFQAHDVANEAYLELREEWKKREGGEYDSFNSSFVGRKARDKNREWLRKTTGGLVGPRGKERPRFASIDAETETEDSTVTLADNLSDPVADAEYSDSTDKVDQELVGDVAARVLDRMQEHGVDPTLSGEYTRIVNSYTPLVLKRLTPRMLLEGRCQLKQWRE